MNEPITDGWRYQHGVGPPPPARRVVVSAPDWFCPGVCAAGTRLYDDDGGMRCRLCGTWYSYAQLAQEDDS